MKNHYISVIIPVYNLENYIENCLNSIVNQTYNELEILCVDDGSSDRSAEIIRSFCEKDARVKYFYQENDGVSAARNSGLEKAAGEYIMFVDSDDFIEKNMIETILKNKENDLTISNYKRYYGKDKIINNIEIDEKIYNKEEFLENFCSKKEKDCESSKKR